MVKKKQTGSDCLLNMLPYKQSSEINYAYLVAQVVSASVTSISFKNQSTLRMWERKKSSENDSLCTELSVKAGNPWWRNH